MISQIFDLRLFDVRQTQWRWLALVAATTAAIGGWTCAPAQAVDRGSLLLLTTPLEPSLFEPGGPDLDPAIVTPERISQTGLTPPSLWWTDEQFGNDLLTYWLAYPSMGELPRRVDLLVNQEIWGNYNYLRRYVFVNQFGTAAKAFGYSTRVFNLQGELLGAYICNFESAPASPTESSTAISETACSVFLNPYGRGAFRGNTTPFGASTPTNGGS